MMKEAAQHEGRGHQLPSSLDYTNFIINNLNTKYIFSPTGCAFLTLAWPTTHYTYCLTNLTIQSMLFIKDHNNIANCILISEIALYGSIDNKRTNHPRSTNTTVIINDLQLCM